MQRSLLSVCPTGLATYAHVHLDSFGKIINHILAIMLLCNVFLFFSSWSVSLLPNVGFSAVFVSFLLIAQTVAVWLILNNNRISSVSFLAPTEYMVGVALGITIGATILSLVLSSAYGDVSRCGRANTAYSDGGSSRGHTYHNATDAGAFGDPIYEYICQQHAGAISAVWFWSGLVCWFNFCTCLLMAVGRMELSQDSQYEQIGGNSSSIVQDFEDQFRRSQAGFPAGDMMNQTPSFVGDYATIPEIRTESGYANGSRSAQAAANVLMV
jgi:hypothetical protein